MANPNWQNTWSAADIDTLLRKRDVEGKPFRKIGAEMSRSKTDCCRVWKLHHVEIQAPSIVSEPAPTPVHRELGINTFEHLQAVTDYVGGFNRETGQYFSPHEYRARVTLPKVFA